MIKLEKFYEILAMPRGESLDDSLVLQSFIERYCDLIHRALIEADETPVSEESLIAHGFGLISPGVYDHQDMSGCLIASRGSFVWKCDVYELLEIKTIGQLRTLERLAGVKHVG